MSIRLPSRARARALALGVLVCLPSQLLAAPNPPARKASSGRKPPAAPADFAAQFASAVSLYERFDYEQALAEFGKAKALARGTEQEVPVSLYLGIVQAELGNHEPSLAAFRTALYLQPDARLPVKVSPRVQSDFEEVHKAVVRDLGLEPPATATAPTPPAASSVTPPAAAPATPPSVVTSPPTPSVTDHPVVASADKPPELAAPVKPIPQAVGYMPALDAERSRPNHTLPLVLLSTAAVTGGGALFFGLQSRNDLASARTDEFYDSRTAHLMKAQQRAFVANVLIGTASAAALLGALTYVFSPGSAPAPALSSGGATP